MPNYYVENADKWKALANIDYFTHFVKAWIPFNAWYRNSYPLLDNDAEIISTIKTESNRLKNRLISLIEGPDEDNESRKFRSYLSDLHYQLERTYIDCMGGHISFLNLVVDKNSKTREEFKYRYFTYKVDIDPGNRKKITTTVLDSAVSPSVERYSITQNNGYNFSEIESDGAYGRLSAEVKMKLKSCYMEVNPRKPVSLLAGETDECIKVGSYRFVNDPNLIARSVITVIYNLRNSLFHGQIVPDKETQKIYEPAYHILSMLVEGLG